MASEIDGPQGDHSSDGRRRRSERSREKILEAVTAAVAEPEIELTAEGIASRAGVSLSTLFRHFGDLEGLSRALRERVGGRARAYFLAGPFAGPVRARVRELIRRRAAVFDLVGPLHTTALRSERLQVEADRDELERALRLQLAEALGAELDRAAEGTAELLAAVLSLPSWMHMRTVQRLDEARAAALLEDAVMRLLGTGDDP